MARARRYRYPSQSASGRAWGIIALTLLICGCGATAPAQDATAERAEGKTAGQLLSAAIEQLAAENYDAARAQALSAAKLAPAAVGVQQRAAEILYLSGHSRESLPLFDRVVELAPDSAPENWQRGIALCSCGDFERGAAQFKTHHEVNPDDVENSAWYFLCIAKTKGIEAARQSVIPSRGDGRQPMMSVLKMLQGELTPAEVLQAAEAGPASGRARELAKFYADLYVGLYYDSLGQEKEAIAALRRSQSYDISGYMFSVARVYLQDRFPDASPAPDQPSK